MPTYTFKDTETGEEFEEFLSISGMEEKTKSGRYVQIHRGKKLHIISQHGSTVSKTPEVFKERLKDIQKRSGKQNTIHV